MFFANLKNKKIFKLKYPGINTHKPKMKYSIIPEIINQKKISFLNEKNVEVPLCDSSPFRFMNPFQKPFIIIDTFAKKTSMPEKIVKIEIDELKKLGFIITTTKAGRNKWFTNQRVIYRIEPSSNISPGSKKINYIPSNHTIQKDVVNNKLKLIGANAGYPRVGNGGPSIQI